MCILATRDRSPAIPLTLQTRASAQRKAAIKRVKGCLPRHTIRRQHACARQSSLCTMEPLTSTSRATEALRTAPPTHMAASGGGATPKPWLGVPLPLSDSDSDGWFSDDVDLAAHADAARSNVRVRARAGTLSPHNHTPVLPRTYTAAHPYVSAAPVTNRGTNAPRGARTASVPHDALPARVLPPHSSPSHRAQRSQSGMVLGGWVQLPSVHPSGLVSP